jgi:hypothetical protein
VNQATFNGEMPNIEESPKEGKTRAQKPTVQKTESLPSEEASIYTTSGESEEDGSYRTTSDKAIFIKMTQFAVSF